ncbi:DUF4328 domain-containing protein [Demequina pelophila]|uniref:DUF4328 domain-containing protein n=1 Tax=Demequina pelophila TaxID=1638984 RepID=UPI000782FEF7|nr:DUF4328 domain-containing protein [Demequina pelophila]
MSDSTPDPSAPRDPFEPPTTPPGMIPGASAPGMIPGAAAPAGYGAYQAGAPQSGAPQGPLLDRNGQLVEPPVTLAKAFLIVTGAVAALTVIGAVLVPGEVDAIRDTLETGELNVTAGVFLQTLTPLLMVASLVTYGLWASRIRRNVEAAGRPAGGPRSVEWWGWFVPLGNMVLPVWGARAISRGAVGWGVLLGWWLPWLASQGAQGAAGAAQFMAIDITSGELTNPEALDQIVPLTWISAVAIVISWVFLRAYVAGTTARHLEAARAQA